MISDGRWIASIVEAIVIVLPVPVAPSSVWKRSPASTPSASDAIAAGWSAAGLYAASSSNFGILQRSLVGRPGPSGALRSAADLSESRALSSAVAELGGICHAVVVLGLKHALHVGARLGKRDVAGREPGPVGAGTSHPLVDVRLAAVVGRHRHQPAAVVLVEQVAQVVAAVGDVD